MWFRCEEVSDPLTKRSETRLRHGGNIELWRRGQTKRAHTLNGDCVSRVHGVDTFTEYGVFNGGGLRDYGLRPI